METSKTFFYEKKQLLRINNRLLEDISYFKGKNVVYLDIPVHSNIGDHLIYRGAMEALKLNNNIILAQFSVLNYSISKIHTLLTIPNTIIVFHGGGNFGDIYGQHQNFRLDIIRKFPTVEIVVLPQSVHFNNEEIMAEQLEVFASENITVHVRDTYSFNLLKDYGVTTVLSPDCAHSLIETLHSNRKLQAQEKTLVFRRRDVEARNENTDGFDWDDLLDKPDAFVFRAVRKLSHLKVANKISLMLFKWYSNRIITKAKVHFKKFDLVNTDRLHGFILAILMGLKVNHQDNTYLKITRYRETWLEKTD